MSTWNDEAFGNDVAEKYLQDLIESGDPVSQIRYTFEQVSHHCVMTLEFFQQVRVSTRIVALACSDHKDAHEDVNRLVRRYGVMLRKNVFSALESLDILQTFYSKLTQDTNEYKDYFFLGDSDVAKNMQSYSQSFVVDERLLRNYASVSLEVFHQGSLRIMRINDTPWKQPFSYVVQGAQRNISSNSRSILGAAVLAVTTDDKVVLVSQRRPALGWEKTYEIPRGGADAGETGEQVAARELLEETGLNAEKLIYLGDMVPDSGLASAKIPVYFTRVENVNESFISDETCVHLISLEQFKENIAAGKVQDSFTAYAVLVAMMKNLL